MKRISLLRCCIAASLLVASTIAQALDQVDGVYPVSYTHLTLPTNREV